ncbi:MAG: response regulator [bacterium]
MLGKRAKENACEGNGRVLVMDDEEKMRDIAKRMLNIIGFEVSCAKNGEETIALYRTAEESGKSFDAVIMDLEILHGMDGKRAMKKLKQLDPHVKAIVCSGAYANVAASDYQQYGFSAILSKPFNISELVQTMNEVMK